MLTTMVLILLFCCLFNFLLLSLIVIIIVMMIVLYTCSMLTQFHINLSNFGQLDPMLSSPVVEAEMLECIYNVCVCCIL